MYSFAISSTGLFVPPHVITNEELDVVWADKKPPKAGLDVAVNRGNAILGAHPQLKKVQPF